MNYHLTPKSSNKKTGPIPTSVSAESTCPAACPLKNDGCYAEGGPLALHWRKVSEGARGVSFDEFCEQVAALPASQLWRHNVAGDLPGADNKIDAKQLEQLVKANTGKRGFTYTHYPPSKHNIEAIRRSNDAGFTINLSANSATHADELMVHGLPVTAVVSSKALENITTPAGNTIVICPAVTRDDVTCESCQMCQRSNRSIIIGFPAHGNRAKRIDIKLRA